MLGDALANPQDISSPHGEPLLADRAPSSFGHTLACLAKGLHLLEGRTAADFGAASGFVAAVAGVAAKGLVVWIAEALCRREAGALYGPGLVEFGIDPDRMLFVEAPGSRDVLWAVEQAVTSAAVGAVVGEVYGGRGVDLTATRRIALRSEQAGRPAYLLSCGDDVGATAARTRWRVAPAASHSSLAPTLLGQPTWSLDLVKSRFGPCAHHLVSFCPRTRRFVEVQPAPRAGALAATPRQGARVVARQGVVPLEALRRRLDKTDPRG